METSQLDFGFKGDLGIPGRTPEHEDNEREAAQMGFPYCEITRTLRLTFDGIGYEIFDAILSWRVVDDCLICQRCGAWLDVIAPNFLHAVPLARCQCAGALMTPVDDRDRALLELAYPVTDSDKRLAERFQNELHRLQTASGENAL